MRRESFLINIICVFSFMFVLTVYCTSEEQSKFDVIKLLKPKLQSGKLLMQALNDRKSIRTFSPKELPAQLLSNLLWAGFGVNRKDGKHTAPTAVNAQNIIIYVAMKNGLYKYLPEKYQLLPIVNKDIRAEIGFQDFLKVAPVVLIYTADLSALSKMSKNDRIFYSAANTGYISQNIYLYCASEKLATVAVGWVKKDAVSKLLMLEQDEKVMLVQPVGFLETN